MILLLYNFHLTGNVTEITYLSAGKNFSKLSFSHLNFNSLERIYFMLKETSKWLFCLGLFFSGNLKESDPLDLNAGVICTIISIGYLADGSLNKKEKNNITDFKELLLLSICFLVFGHLFYNFQGGRFGERFFFEVSWVILLGFILFLVLQTFLWV